MAGHEVRGHVEQYLRQGTSVTAAAKKLRLLLKANKALLAHPLTKSARNAGDKAKLESKDIEIAGSRRRLGDQFVEQALKLSEQLNINEIDAAQWLWKASPLMARHPELKQSDVAELLFYQNRQDLLYSLACLCRARQENLPADVIHVASQFSDELLREGLVGHLLGQIKERLPLPPPATPEAHPSLSPLSTSQMYVAVERHLLCDLLFVIAYKSSLRPADGEGLLGLLREASTTLHSALPDISAVPPPHSGAGELYRDVFALMVTAVLSLDVSGQAADFVSSPYADAAPLTLGSNYDFIKAADKIVTAKQPWTHSGVHAVVSLGWGLLLRRLAVEGGGGAGGLGQILSDANIEGTVSYAIETDFSVFVSQVVSSPQFAAEPSRDIYLDVLDELLSSFLSTMAPRAREMKTEQEELMLDTQTYKKYKVGPERSFKPHFDNLILAIAAVYKDQPRLAEKYWDADRHPDLHQFLRFAGENIFPSAASLGPFLKMLTALSGGTECALAAFDFLRDNTRRYANWDQFFVVLEKYFVDFQQPPPLSAFDDLHALPWQQMQQQQQQAPRLVFKEEDVYLLECILDLLACVVRWLPSGVRLAMVQSPSWRPLDALFKLLTCAVPPVLKAALVRAIGTFAREPSLTPKIWQYLDAIQLVGGTGREVTGLRFELAQVESTHEEYPYSTAVLHLFHQLLYFDRITRQENTSLVSSATDMSPYASFVVFDVLNALDQRPYKSDQDKWRLAQPALRSVLQLLRLALAPSAGLDAPTTTEGTGAAMAVDAPPQDGPQAQPRATTPEQAGLRVFEMFLQLSPLLGKVLDLLATAVESLADLRLSQGGLAFEDCVISSLKILLLVLTHQETVLAYRTRAPAGPEGRAVRGSRWATGSSLLTPLHKLLELNRGHIVALSRFIDYKYNTLVNTLSVKILHKLATRQELNVKLVRILVEASMQQRLIAAYVEKLEADETLDEFIDRPMDALAGPFAFEDNSHTSDEFASLSDADAGTSIGADPRSVRAAILALMIDSAKQPVPNLAQLLIGISPMLAQTAPAAAVQMGRAGAGLATSALTATGAFAPGQAESLQSQQRSISSHTLLEALVARVLRSPATLRAHPTLAALGQRLLYTLISERSTQLRVTTYLRSVQQDFFTHQLAHLGALSPPPAPSASSAMALDFAGPDDGVSAVAESEEWQLLEARGWLLKSIALELHMTRGTGHRSYTSKLLDSLYSLLSASPSTDDDAVGGEFDTAATEFESPVQPRMKMRELIDVLEVPLMQPGPTYTEPTRHYGTVQFEHFSAPDSEGYPQIDIYLLHQHLLDQNAKLEADWRVAPTDEQTQQLREEMSRCLHRAVAWNEHYKRLAALSSVMRGWRQILTVSLTECLHLIPSNTREPLLYELLEMQLQQLNVLFSPAVPEASARSAARGSPAVPAVVEDLFLLGLAITENVLLLTTKLRQQLQSVGLTSLAPGSAGGPGGAEAMSAAFYLPSEQLHAILRSLVHAVITHGHTLQMRGNLYGALMNYLRFTQTQALQSLSTPARSTPGALAAEQPNPHLLQRMSLVEELETQHKSLRRGNAALLQAPGEKLIDLLATDACDAASVWQATAFATFDQLFALDYDVEGKWLHYLARRGFLAHFLDDLTRPDRQRLLGQLFTPVPDQGAFMELFIYESRLSFLVSVANSSPQGAQILLDNHTISSLTRCRFLTEARLDQFADLAFGDDQSGDGAWLPTVVERFFGLLLPALRLICAVQTQLPRNEDLAGQVLDFVKANFELVTTLLKDHISAWAQSATGSANALAQSRVASLGPLLLVTAIFFHLAQHPHLLAAKLSPAQATEIQGLLLALLRKYATLDKRWQGDAKVLRLTNGTVVGICANLLGFCRRLSLSTAVAPGRSFTFVAPLTGVKGEARGGDLLFSASMKAADPFRAPQLSSAAEQRIPVGVLVHYLRVCLGQLQTALEDKKLLDSSLSSLPELRPDQLIQIMGDASGIGGALQTAILASSDAWGGTAALGSGEGSVALSLEEITSNLSLTAHQRLALAQRLLSHALRSTIATLAALRYNVEHVLTLLWKHLAVFLASGRGSEGQAPELTPGATPGDLSRQFGLTKQEREALKQSVASELRPALDQLTKNKDWPAEISGEIVGLLNRRLRDLLSL